jgi:hypothetical protein
MGRNLTEISILVSYDSFRFATLFLHHHHENVITRKNVKKAFAKTKEVMADKEKKKKRKSGMEENDRHGSPKIKSTVKVTSN